MLDPSTNRARTAVLVRAPTYSEAQRLQSLRNVEPDSR